MILLTAVLAGLLAGLLRARSQNKAWQLPELKYIWLVVVSFVPQLLVFYLPGWRAHLPDVLVAVCLVGSQVGLLIFCLLNRRQKGMLILAGGLLLNLLVIVANGGFMPLSTETVAQWVPEQVLRGLKVGSPLGAGSKDILLAPAQIIFPWLADRFVVPGWFPYQFVFSIGDVFIGVGAFLLLSMQPTLQRGSIEHVSKPDDQYPDDSPKRAPGADGSEPLAGSGADQQPVL
jgi:MFS family permease